MAEMLLGLLILVAAFVVWYVIGLMISAVANIPTNGPGDVFGNIFFGAMITLILGAVLFIARMIGFIILHG